MSLGENIYNLRKAKKLSQEKLAEKIDVTRQTISNWELNVTQPNPEQLKLLSINLEITVDSLLNHDFNEAIEKPIEALESNHIEQPKKSNILMIVIMSAMAVIIISLIIGLIISINSNNQINNDDNTTEDVNQNNDNTTDDVGQNDDNTNSSDAIQKEDEASEYSVVYDYNNNEPLEACIVTAGSLISLPTAIPQLEGYVFDGWYFNNVKWNFELDKVSTNMILEAKYKSVDQFLLKDSLSNYISEMEAEYIDSLSYKNNQILDSSFYVIGEARKERYHSLGEYRIVLQAMNGNVSMLGVKVNGPCVIGIKMATESEYGFTSTLSEYNILSDNGIYSHSLLNIIGKSNSNAKMTSVYYYYQKDESTTLYFGVNDRSMGIFDIEILESE